MKIPWTKLIAWIKRLVRRWFNKWTDGAARSAPEPKAFPFSRVFYWAKNRITGNLYLLTIGNSDFRGRANNLPACKTDAERMARLYAKYGAEVRERHNLGAAEMWAEIERALSRLDGSKTVIIHVSSHGTQIRDVNREEADGKDEAICGSDMGLIGDDEIFSRCSSAVKANGGNLVLVFDTCHSGGMVRVADVSGVRSVLAEAVPDTELASFRARMRDLPRVDRSELPYAVLAACEEHTYAYDGVFTPAYVSACQDLGNAYASKVLARTSDRIRNQTPLFFGNPEIKVFG
ncbi:MAG: caspase family protein [Candidatus Hydrogenedentes bacterium]|nr:caspase family protein [Candidatus Hydrogenedentota bacterium]